MGVVSRYVLTIKSWETEFVLTLIYLIISNQFPYQSPLPPFGAMVFYYWLRISYSLTYLIVGWLFCFYSLSDINLHGGCCYLIEWLIIYTPVRWLSLMCRIRNVSNKYLPRPTFPFPHIHLTQQVCPTFGLHCHYSLILNFTLTKNKSIFQTLPPNWLYKEEHPWNTNFMDQPPQPSILGGRKHKSYNPVDTYTYRFFAPITTHAYYYAQNRPLHIPVFSAN